jgi:hypothetical protein
MMERFQSDRTSVVDEDRSGRPTTSQTTEYAKRMNFLVQKDRRITVTDIADKLDISCGSAYSITHTNLRYQTLCAM